MLVLCSSVITYLILVSTRERKVSMITPALLQANVQRSQDITQIKQNEDIKPQVEHAVISSKQQEKEVKQQEQVRKQDNTEQQQKKYDAKEKGNGTYYGQNNQKRKKSERDIKEDGTVTVKKKYSFDMKV